MADLVLFDLDGVLVDSERLAVRLESELVTALGWPLSEFEVVERFVGRSAEHLRAEVEAAIGRPVDWAAEFDPHYVALFERELTATPGATEALDRLDAAGVPYCVASSSSRDQIALKLTVTDLAARFADSVFSCDDVAAPKPAPDVYLHAARAYGVDPARCVVVEDSPTGCRAGLAAGMRVLGLVTPLVDPERLRALGAELVEGLGEVPVRLGI